MRNTCKSNKGTQCFKTRATVWNTIGKVIKQKGSFKLGYKKFQVGGSLGMKEHENNTSENIRCSEITNCTSQR